MSRPLIVVPARYGSERLKGKMLLTETGKPLVQHTWEACCEVPDADVLIATDHDDIFQAAQGFGADVVMTDHNHMSGTVRVAEAAQGRDASMVINCQGDEPEVEPSNIQKLIDGHMAAMAEGGRTPFISTLACPFPDDLDTNNPNTVKVVTTAKGGASEDALYFSRSVMPFPRTRAHRPHMHIGLYGFAPDALQRFAAMQPSELEKTESLEQLRALEAGERICVMMVDRASPGIDTREDYDAFVARQKAR
ncbi:MAG: 3-deoxy-manno-octulosonate cytidylyltransferase [Pseudomonadota bacterium]